MAEATVVSQQPVSGDYNTLIMEVPEVSSIVKPGQFIHMRVPRLEHLVLRRPFSVFRADDKHLTLLYKRVGKGTESMTLLTTGDEIDLMGPLGNGFPMECDGDPVLVAGGYGVAPLYLLAERLGRTGDIFIGGRSADDVLCVEDFKKLGWTVHVSTDDGSMGEEGLVTETMGRWLAGQADEKVFYACGPDGMLRAVGDIGIGRDNFAWLSLDKHMGCGAGACLACVQRVRDEEGNETWARVCREGPVFDARDIIWP
ncbi:hypothetical protein BVX97_02050 [bacterium E08(2017)]|nr:hypothetical protein BVX97_02050 [bacterium E08(2017)]